MESSLPIDLVPAVTTGNAQVRRIVPAIFRIQNLNTCVLDLHCNAEPSSRITRTGG